MNKLITIEGPDAVGKATQAALLAEYLDGKVVSFPRYDTPQGRLIKKYLFGKFDGFLDEEERAIGLQSVMTWDRYAGYDMLSQAVAGERDIVTDRYWMSGYVYGRLDGLDEDTLLRIHESLPQPRVAIFLEVPVDEQIRRLKARGRPVDKYEKEDLCARMIHEYDGLWDRLEVRMPHVRWLHVDGVGSVVEVHQRIKEGTCVYLHEDIEVVVGSTPLNQLPTVCTCGAKRTYREIRGEDAGPRLEAVIGR